MNNIVKQFIAITGESGVIHGEDVKKRSGDWLNKTICNALCVVRPKTTDELSQIMKICNDNDIGVVASGGLTGLVHGTDCTKEQVQISLERMNKVISVDEIGKTMLVEAGTPLEKVHQIASEHDLTYAVDLGARGSCTIGGNISTNAGGNTVIRYGMTREQILGLEAVLADGTIVSSLNSLLKNNTGYDLKQLLIGAEGTLGIVTKAVLRLHPKTKSKNMAFIAVDDFVALTNIFKAASNAFGGNLTSFEVLWGDHYRLLTKDSGRNPAPLPTDYAYYAIFEAQGLNPEKDKEHFDECFAEFAENELLIDGVIAQSEAQAKSIWAIREDIAGLYELLSPLALFDVSMPIKDMDNYINDLTKNVKAKWGKIAQVSVFGHLGDGNLHIAVSPKVWEDNTHREIEELVYTPLKALGGSVSAEHGIGLEKRDFLHNSRSKIELNIMRSLKKTLDPKGILNAGKIFN